MLRLARCKCEHSHLGGSRSRLGSCVNTPTGSSLLKAAQGHRRTGLRSSQATTWNTPIPYPWFPKRKQRIHSFHAGLEPHPAARDARSVRQKDLCRREKLKRERSCKGVNTFLTQTLKRLRELGSMNSSHLRPSQSDSF
jgi:hypothetical protein